MYIDRMSICPDDFPIDLVFPWRHGTVKCQNHPFVFLSERPLKDVGSIHGGYLKTTASLDLGFKTEGQFVSWLNSLIRSRSGRFQPGMCGGNHYNAPVSNKRRKLF